MTDQAASAASVESKGAIATATETASDAVASLTDAIDQNPLAILLGGLALGAIAGALLPRSDKESELLAPIGGRIADAARNASGAAREAGLGAFDSAGINKDAARTQVDKLIEAASAAARDAGAAALKAVREA